MFALNKPHMAYGTILSALFALLLAPSAMAGHGHDWDYGPELGPSRWGDLKPEYATCKKGHHQSPVDLRWGVPQQARAIEFDYRPSGYRVVDNGHTVQVNFDPGNFVKVEGRSYELVQAHFHSTSEHTISGRSYPLEAHLVHKDASGKLAVVGVLFNEGNINLSLGKIWAGIPGEKEREGMGEGRFNPESFLPPARTHYHYLGSLTTPPCTEGVNWNVFNTPIEASREQIERFRRLYSGNFRPVQPLHGRRPANY